MVNKLDENIVFLMKFGSNQHITALQDNGELYFSPPKTFLEKSNNSEGQYDKWDSHQNAHATHLVYAELLYEDESGPHYGPVKKFADKADIHRITTITKSIPMTCFRLVTLEDIDINGCFKIAESDLNKIKEEFPDYDTFILVPALWLINAIERNNENYKIMFSKIEYGYGETSENLPEHLKMFNKLEKYEYQKEFRFILPEEQFDAGKTIHIPPLKNASIIGDIEDLKSGYTFGTTRDDLVKSIIAGNLNYEKCI